MRDKPQVQSGKYKVKSEKHKKYLDIKNNPLVNGYISILYSLKSLQMKDMNRADFNSTTLPRQAELDALLSSQFKSGIEKNNIRLVTYRDIINEYGIKN